MFKEIFMMPYKYFFNGRTLQYNRHIKMGSHNILSQWFIKTELPRPRNGTSTLYTKDYTKQFPFVIDTKDYNTINISYYGFSINNGKIISFDEWDTYFG